MLFNSLVFAVFFIIFYFLYHHTKNRLSVQNVLILVSSYIFYGAWDERFLVLIAGSTLVDYLSGFGTAGQAIDKQEKIKASAFLFLVSVAAVLPTFSESYWILLYVMAFIPCLWLVIAFIDRYQGDTRRKAYLFLSVFVNIGLLGIFKYFNFFTGAFVDLMANFGWTVDYVTINVILPVGISFYTFQTLSYTIDIYRKQLQPTRHFVQFAAFVSFFPQLVAGPIERARSLLPQFEVARKVTAEGLKIGAYLFFWGLFKKMVVADNLALIADPVFASPGEYSSLGLLAGLLAFTFQIFCDFSGYSDMARGIAKSMGFELMVNFRIPYISRTPSEFWLRWHISLSSWLRDYIYIPLGGNRGGSFMTYRNLTLTMLLGGLWHGANWTFIVWGAFHGSILVIYRVLKVDDWLPANNSTKLHHMAINGIAIATMFALIMVSWVYFRAESLDLAHQFLGGLFNSVGVLGGDWRRLAVLILPLLFWQCLQLYKGRLNAFYDYPWFIRFNLGLFVFCALMFMANTTSRQFIYFDF